MMAGRYGSVVFLRLQAELDRLFKEALELHQGDVQNAAWQPAIDVIETPSSIVILVESPGCGAADIKLEVKGPLLHISGTRSAPHQPQVKYLRLERSQGRFVREVQLLWPVNTHAGTAVLADGLLKIEFPKIEDKRHAPRLLDVQEPPPATGGVRRNR
jgi:HSP20 family protein